MTQQGLNKLVTGWLICFIWVLTFSTFGFGQTPLAGSLPGNLTHTRSGGSTYKIPLAIPKARNGLKPAVSLQYNSNGGYGIAGEGWDLSAGVSSISRSSKSFEYDGVREGIQFDIGDPFTLDGIRLMLVDGTHGADGAVYYTHQETYQRVELVDIDAQIPGPDHFVVHAPSGLTKYYGTSPDALVRQLQGEGPVLTWLLKTVIDQDGNKMVYSYWNCPANNDFCGDHGGNRGFALKAITFNLIDGQTTPYHAKVRVNYEGRPDHDHVFQNGVPFSQTRRISDIGVFVNADGDLDDEEAEDVYRTYRLVYETSGGITGRSRLASVQAFGPQGDSLPPTSFSYSGNLNQRGFEAFQGYTQTPLSNFANIALWTGDRPLTGKYNLGTHMVDLNGDGLKDLIQGLYMAASHNHSEEVVKRIWMNRGNSFEELPANAAYLTTWTGNGTAGLFSVLSSEFPNANPGGDLGTRLADINGDGLVDMVQLLNAVDSGNPSIPPNPSSQIRIYLNRGETLGWEELQSSHPWIALINTEFGGIGTVYFSKTIRQETYHHTSVSGGCRLVDVNGDGLPDLVIARSQVNGTVERVLLNQGENQQAGGWLAGSAFETSLQNLLGTGSWSRAYLAKNVGQLNDPGDWLSDTGFRIRDLNGDGLPDLMVLNQGYGIAGHQRAVALNRGAGDGFVADNRFTASLAQTDGCFFSQIREGSDVHGKGTNLTDLNGDGYPDLLTLYRDVSGERIQRLYWNTGKDFVAATGIQFPEPDVYFDYFSSEFSDGGGTRSGGTRLADLNGDGLMDLITLMGGRGSGTQSGAPRQAVHRMVFSASTIGWQKVNLNQDPWLDNLPGDLYFNYVRPSGQPFGQYDMGVRLDDVNGDGRLDIVQLVQADTILNRQAFWLAKSAMLTRLDLTEDVVTHADKLQRVENGIGAVVECHYLPATAGAELYAPGPRPAYPIRHQTPGQLLARITRHQTQSLLETTPPRTTSFQYSGNAFQLDLPGVSGPNGRGALGFSRIRAKDHQKNHFDFTYYHQNYPLTGKVSQTRQTHILTGHDLDRRHFRYRITANIPGNLHKTYRIDNFQNWQIVLEDGQEVYRTFQATFRDDYGNPFVSVDGGRSDMTGDERYTHRTFKNHPDLWLFGLPETTIQSTDNNPAVSNAWLSKVERIYDADKPHRLWKQKRVSLEGEGDAVITYAYNGRGMVETVTNPLGSVLSFTYDSKFGMYPVEEKEIKDGAVHLTTTVYDDKSGTILERTSPTGLTTATVYDDMDRPIEIWSEAPGSENMVLTNTTLYEPGPGTRGMKKTDKVLQSWAYDLAAEHRKTVTITDTWGREVRQTLSATGHSRMRRTETSYDAQGRQFAQSLAFDASEPDPQKYYRRTFYDAKDRIVRIEHPQGADSPLEIETYDYQVAAYEGRSIQVTRHEGRHQQNLTGQISLSYYDARNQVVARGYFASDNEYDEIRYHYDGIGRVEAIYSQANSDGQRVKTQSVYNSLGQKTDLFEKVVLLDNGTETVLSQKHFRFTYNAMDQLVERIDANDHRTMNHYDAWGRLVRQDLDPDQLGFAGNLRWVDYTYENQVPNQLGLLKSVTGYADETTQNPVFRYGLTYDKYGRIAEKNVWIDGLDELTSHLTYRPDGQRLTLTYPDQTILESQYHPLGMLSRLRLVQPDGAVTDLAHWDSFNIFGQPTALTYGNGVTTAYDYRPQDGKLDLMSVGSVAKGILAQKEYVWEDRGLLEAIVDHWDSSFSQDFIYDDLRRLIAADGVYGARDYDYDLAGNMLMKGDLSYQGFHGFEVDATLDQASGEFSEFTYDENGNVVAKLVGDRMETFTYDPLDRMVTFRVTQPNQASLVDHYHYDQSGRRLRKSDADGVTAYYPFSHYEVVRSPGRVDRFTKYVSGYGNRIAQITQLGPAPDLAVTNLQATQIGNHAHRMAVEITNLGEADSPEATLGWAAGEGQVLTSSLTIPPLSSGASTLLEFEIVSEPGQVLTAYADPANLVEEADETNNQSSLSLPFPDLVSELLEAHVLDSKSFRIVVNVRNAGTAGTLDESTMRWETPAGVTSHTVPVLAPGAGVNVSGTVAVLAEGDILTGKVDAFNALAELDEANNYFETVLGVPDYSLDHIYLEISKDGQGPLFFTVSNLGTAPAPPVPFIASLIRKGNVIADFEGMVPQLGLDKKVTLPANLDGVLPRDELHVRVNPATQGVILELDYDNNEGQISFLPDLAITASNASGRTCLENVTVTIANQGNVALPSLPITLTIVPDGDRKFTMSGIVPKLEAGNSAEVEFDVLGQGAVCNEATLIMMIDPDETYPDLDRHNNSQSLLWNSPLTGELR